MDRDTRFCDKSPQNQHQRDNSSGYNNNNRISYITNNNSKKRRMSNSSDNDDDDILKLVPLDSCINSYNTNHNNGWYDNNRYKRYIGNGNTSNNRMNNNFNSNNYNRVNGNKNKNINRAQCNHEFFHKRIAELQDKIHQKDIRIRETELTVMKREQDITDLKIEKERDLLDIEKNYDRKLKELQQKENDMLYAHDKELNQLNVILENKRQIITQLREELEEAQKDIRVTRAILESVNMRNMELNTKLNELQDDKNKSKSSKRIQTEKVNSSSVGIQVDVNTDCENCNEKKIKVADLTTKIDNSTAKKIEIPRVQTYPKSAKMARFDSLDSVGSYHRSDSFDSPVSRDGDMKFESSIFETSIKHVSPVKNSKNLLKIAQKNNSKMDMLTLNIDGTKSEDYTVIDYIESPDEFPIGKGLDRISETEEESNGFKEISEHEKERSDENSEEYLEVFENNIGDSVENKKVLPKIGQKFCELREDSIETSPRIKKKFNDFKQNQTKMFHTTKKNLEKKSENFQKIEKFSKESIIEEKQKIDKLENANKYSEPSEDVIKSQIKTDLDIIQEKSQEIKDELLLVPHSYEKLSTSPTLNISSAKSNQGSLNSHVRSKPMTLAENSQSYNQNSLNCQKKCKESSSSILNSLQNNQSDDVSDQNKQKMFNGNQNFESNNQSFQNSNQNFQDCDNIIQKSVNSCSNYEQNNQNCDKNNQEFEQSEQKCDQNNEKSYKNTQHINKTSPQQVNNNKNSSPSYQKSTKKSRKSCLKISKNIKLSTKFQKSSKNSQIFIENKESLSKTHEFSNENSNIDDNINENFANHVKKSLPEIDNAQKCLQTQAYSHNDTEKSSSDLIKKGTENDKNEQNSSDNKNLEKNSSKSLKSRKISTSNPLILEKTTTSEKIAIFENTSNFSETFPDQPKPTNNFMTVTKSLEKMTRDLMNKFGIVQVSPSRPKVSNDIFKSPQKVFENSVEPQLNQKYIQNFQELLQSSPKIQFSPNLQETRQLMCDKTDIQDSSSVLSKESQNLSSSLESLSITSELQDILNLSEVEGSTDENLCSSPIISSEGFQEFAKITKEKFLQNKTARESLHIPVKPCYTNNSETSNESTVDIVTKNKQATCEKTTATCGFNTNTINTEHIGVHVCERDNVLDARKSCDISSEISADKNDLKPLESSGQNDQKSVEMNAMQSENKYDKVELIQGFDKSDYDKLSTIDKCADTEVKNADDNGQNSSFDIEKTMNQQKEGVCNENINGPIDESRKNSGDYTYVVFKPTIMISGNFSKRNSESSIEVEIDSSKALQELEETIKILEGCPADDDKMKNDEKKIDNNENNRKNDKNMTWNAAEMEKNEAMSKTNEKNEHKATNEENKIGDTDVQNLEKSVKINANKKEDKNDNQKSLQNILPMLKDSESHSKMDDKSKKNSSTTTSEVNQKSTENNQITKDLRQTTSGLSEVSSNDRKSIEKSRSLTNESYEKEKQKKDIRDEESQNIEKNLTDFSHDLINTQETHTENTEICLKSAISDKLQQTLPSKVSLIMDTNNSSTPNKNSPTPSIHQIKPLKPLPLPIPRSKSWTKAEDTHRSFISCFESFISTRTDTDKSKRQKEKNIWPSKVPPKPEKSEKTEEEKDAIELRQKEFQEKQVREKEIKIGKEDEEISKNIHDDVLIISDSSESFVGISENKKVDEVKRENLLISMAIRENRKKMEEDDQNKIVKDPSNKQIINTSPKNETIGSIVSPSTFSKSPENIQKPTEFYEPPKKVQILTNEIIKKPLELNAIVTQPHAIFQFPPNNPTLMAPQSPVTQINTFKTQPLFGPTLKTMTPLKPQPSVQKNLEVPAENQSLLNIQQHFVEIQALPISNQSRILEFPAQILQSPQKLIHTQPMFTLKSQNTYQNQTTEWPISSTFKPFQQKDIVPKENLKLKLVQLVKHTEIDTKALSPNMEFYMKNGEPDVQIPYNGVIPSGCSINLEREKKKDNEMIIDKRVENDVVEKFTKEPIQGCQQENVYGNQQNIDEKSMDFYENKQENSSEFSPNIQNEFISTDFSRNIFQKPVECNRSIVNSHENFLQSLDQISVNLPKFSEIKEKKQEIEPKIIKNFGVLQQKCPTVYKILTNNSEDSLTSQQDDQQQISLLKLSEKDHNNKNFQKKLHELQILSNKININPCISQEPSEKLANCQSESSSKSPVDDKSSQMDQIKSELNYKNSDLGHINLDSNSMNSNSYQSSLDSKGINSDSIHNSSDQINQNSKQIGLKHHKYSSPYKNAREKFKNHKEIENELEKGVCSRIVEHSLKQREISRSSEERNYPIDKTSSDFDNQTKNKSKTKMLAKRRQSMHERPRKDSGSNYRPRCRSRSPIDRRYLGRSININSSSNYSKFPNNSMYKSSTSNQDSSLRGNSNCQKNKSVHRGPPSSSLSPPPLIIDEPNQQKQYNKNEISKIVISELNVFYELEKFESDNPKELFRGMARALTHYFFEKNPETIPSRNEIKNYIMEIFFNYDTIKSEKDFLLSADYDDF